MSAPTKPVYPSNVVVYPMRRLWQFVHHAVAHPLIALSWGRLWAWPPHTGYFRPQAEYVAWGSAGHLDKAPGRGPWPGVIHARADKREKLHMTGKPLSVMQQLVQAVPPGGLVVDPFAGSGTTIAACIREGRRGLGFDTSAEYVAIANRRLEQELAGFGASRASVIDAQETGQGSLSL